MPDIHLEKGSKLDDTPVFALKSQVPPTPTPSGSPKAAPVSIAIKHPLVLWEKTQTVIKNLEQKIGSRILVYFTHPSASINNDDVDYFFSHVKEVPAGSSISLIIVSSGGSGMAAWRIASVLRKYCQSVNAIVPSRAASAATLLALSADKILFGPAGYLTAIDTSLVHPLNPIAPGGREPSKISVDQVNKIRKFIEDDLKVHPSSKSLSEILFEKIHPIVFGELERSSNLSKMIARNMMKLRSPELQDDYINRVIDILNDAYPAHGYPIVYSEALEIGLPAEPLPEELNPLVWELVKLYSLITKKVITNFSPELYHVEGTPVVIESVGRRTFYSMSYDSRYQTNQGRVTENDKTRWLSAIPNLEDPTKPKLSEIEL